MSLISADTINPMDWHNTKFLTFIPDHFVRVKFRHIDDRQTVLEWIQQNTVGRFAITTVLDINRTENRSWVTNDDYQIGFENPAEATMYTMFFR